MGNDSDRGGGGRGGNLYRVLLHGTLSRREDAHYSGRSPYSLHGTVLSDHWTVSLESEKRRTRRDKGKRRISLLDFRKSNQWVPFGKTEQLSFMTRQD